MFCTRTCSCARANDAKIVRSTQRVLGSPEDRGQRANIASCCEKRREKMNGGKLCDVQKTILERDQGFFRHSFIRNQYGQC